MSQPDGGRADAGEPREGRAPRPLCFVLMPFGQKQDSTGTLIDFDAVYAQLLRPAIESAGMEPIRADEEMSGGIIHKPMFERLVLCEFAIADLTTANANVFYELGVRHAVRPWSTVLVFAEGTRLPFDTAPLRGLPYTLEAGTPADVDATRTAIAERLRAARAKTQDSPVFELLRWERVPDVAHMSTDVFRDRARYSAQRKAELATARAAGKKAREPLRAVEQSLGPIEDVEAGVVVDLFLSYRDAGAWDEMVRIADAMEPALRATVMVQEQLALALNRLGRRADAERILLSLIEQRGPSSETYGILGRVYKDRWKEMKAANNAAAARGMLKKAIDAYLRGFETDWRDAYPGINALTLMELSDPPDPRRIRIAPVVRYAVERKIARGKPDYWDHATLLELAVLSGDEGGATAALSDALAAEPKDWMRVTTADNLGQIRETRVARGEVVAWADAIEQELRRIG